MKNKILISIIGIFLVLSISGVFASYGDYANLAIKFKQIPLGGSGEQCPIQYDTPYLKLKTFDYDVWANQLNSNEIRRGPNCPASACQYDCYNCPSGQVCTSETSGVCVNAGTQSQWTKEFNMADELASGKKVSGFLTGYYGAMCKESYFEKQEIRNISEVPAGELQTRGMLIEKFPEILPFDGTYTCHGSRSGGSGYCSGTCPAGTACSGNSTWTWINGYAHYSCFCLPRIASPTPDISKNCTCSALPHSQSKSLSTVGTLGLYGHSFLGAAPTFVLSNMCDGADINLDVEVNELDLAILNQNMNRTDCTERNWCNGGDVNKDALVSVTDLALMQPQFGRTDCNSSNEWCSSTDINMNGKVDATDMAILQNQFGKSTCNARDAWCNNADIDRNGAVDNTDFHLWDGWNPTKAC